MTPVPQFIIDKVKKLCDDFRIPHAKCTPRVVRKFLRMMHSEQMDMIKARTHTKARTALDSIREYAKSSSKTEKTTRYTDYYKQCPEISKQISGVSPPIITPMQEERISNMFSEAIIAYKTSPRYIYRTQHREGRKKTTPNNQACHYLLYKICQLLGYTEFLVYIPLPKSNDNIDDNDNNGWRHICQVNNWQYIPTR